MLLLAAAAVRRFFPRPSAGGTTTTLRTIYDGANAWADFGNTNVLQTRYLFTRAIDEVLARLSSTSILAWDLPDLLGSVRDLSDGAGTAVLDHVKYDSYGNILSESSPSSGDRFKYTAREWDAATSQYFYRARYYNSGAGRFTGQDPLGFSGGDANIAAYVGNLPITEADPTGLMHGIPPRIYNYTDPLQFPPSIRWPGISPSEIPYIPDAPYHAYTQFTPITWPAQPNNQTQNGGWRSTVLDILDYVEIAATVVLIIAGRGRRPAIPLRRLQGIAGPPGAILPRPRPVNIPRIVDINRLIPPQSRPIADPNKLHRMGKFDWSRYQPITVEADGGRLYIQDGMTRVQRAREAGITQLPAYVFPKSGH